MIVTCPSCATHFSVPEEALGPRGRTLRCARCGHKWHQDPLVPADEVPLEMAPAPAARPVAPRPAAADPFAFSGLPAEEAPAALDEPAEDGLPGFKLDLGGQGASFNFSSDGFLEEEHSLEEPPNAGVDDPFAHIAELMSANAGDPLPDMFAAPPPKPRRRKGAVGLWLLVLVILLGGGGFGLYGLQDKVVDLVPAAGPVYEQLGLRNAVVGAGLIFRNYSSERTVQNNIEVLIVRGVIANTTGQTRALPLLRLALYNNKTLLQKKIISPPQSSLGPKATVGFRITLDQPDAAASRFEVTFTNAKEPPQVPAAAESGKAP
ncbi:hypothetical protein GALL_208330 [mine drainage metagenome]|uniref:Zinc finger/thioredoxin putative domain-containing protein n=1 Tax=mine drainage metagenome TaxID=410659 RepID=A0A1J5RM83_9ZZZZ